MRRWILIAGLLGLGAVTAAALAFAFYESTPGTVVASSAGERTERLLLAVDKLTCGSCEVRIRDALTAHPGVIGVGVDLARRTVTVEYDPATAEPRVLAAVVTRAGYPARFRGLGPAVPPPAKPSKRRGSGCGGTCCPT